jgi:hypothetical protein
MVSIGADRATADHLAYRFAAEQSQSSMENEERSFRFTRPPSMGTSKAAEVERFSIAIGPQAMKDLTQSIHLH